MRQKPEFRFFLDFSELPRELIDSFGKEISSEVHKSLGVNVSSYSESFFKKGHGRGIYCGNDLVAFVWHSTSARLCEVFYGQTNNRHLRGFVKEFGVLPSKYIWESFIRHGIRFFLYDATFHSGRLMHRRLLKDGLVKLVYHKKESNWVKNTNNGKIEEQGILMVTDKWVKEASSRKRIRKVMHSRKHLIARRRLARIKPARTPKKRMWRI
ncbi:MAG: hypothetical protein ABH986_02695 [archaeon]